MPWRRRSSRWAAGRQRVTSRYRIGAIGLEVEERLEAAPSVLGSASLTWPFPVDDGRDRSTVSFAGDALCVRLGESGQEVRLDGGSLAVTPDRVAHRNGYANIARGPAPAGHVTWRLRYTK